MFDFEKTKANIMIITLMIKNIKTKDQGSTKNRLFVNSEIVLGSTIKIHKICKLQTKQVDFQQFHNIRILKRKKQNKKINNQ